jgi:hypothetical protein
LKHWILTGALGVLVTVSGIAAHAYDPGYGIETSGKGQGEPSLDAIIRTGYSTTGQSTPDTTGPGAGLDSSATFVPVQDFSGMLFKQAGAGPVTYVAHFSGDNTVLGYYTPGPTPSGQTVLTTFTTNGPQTGTGDITNAPNPFGLYITDQPSGNTFYTQAAANDSIEPGGGHDKVTTNSSVTTDANGDPILGAPTKVNSDVHVLVYHGSGNTYYLGFEDLTGSENDGSPTGGGSDRDYNDVVIEVDNVTLTNSPSIPEPAFYQMSVFLAGGGLMALKMRRRSKAN